MYQKAIKVTVDGPREPRRKFFLTVFFADTLCTLNFVQICFWNLFRKLSRSELARITLRETSMSPVVAVANLTIIPAFYRAV